MIKNLFFVVRKLCDLLSAQITRRFFFYSLSPDYIVQLKNSEKSYRTYYIGPSPYHPLLLGDRMFKIIYVFSFSKLRFKLNFFFGPR